MARLKRKLGRVRKAFRDALNIRPLGAAALDGLDRLRETAVAQRFGLPPAPAREPRFVRITLPEHRSAWKTREPRHLQSLIDEVYLQKAYEPSARLDPRVIIDAGGNQGVATRWLAERFPRATIHVFEPSPQTFECLQENTRGLGNRVVLNNAGVWSRNCRQKLFLARTSGSNSLFESHAARQRAPRKRQNPQDQSVSVKLLRLDDYLRERGIGNVDLLKIDIEGGEREALIGLGKRIRDVSHIVGELHLTTGDPNFEKDVVALLERNGFAVRLRPVKGSDVIKLFEATQKR
ncbi:MAG: FkbM family methyltransferase [Candidatus Micrarchaeota archaeon]